MNKLSISNKILYRGMLASLVAFLMILYIMYNLVFYYFKPTIFDHAQINVKNKAEEITSYLVGNKKFLQSVLVNYQKNQNNIVNMAKWLNDSKIDDKYLKHLVYLTRDGNLILDNGQKIDFTTQKNVLKYKDSYYNYLIRDNKKDYLVSDVVFLELEGKKTPVFIQFLVTKDTNNRVTGAIGGMYDIAYLSDIIKNISISNYTLSLITDGNALVIGHTNPNFVAKWNMSKDNRGIAGLEKIILDQATNLHFEIYELYMDTTKIEGANNSEGATKAELRIVMAPIAGAEGWILSVAAPYILILWPMVKTIIAIAISFIVSLVIFMLIFSVSNKLLNREVIKVAEKLKDISVGEGDLTQRLKVLPGKDGLNLLTINFNLFLDSIANLVKEIQTQYETLDGYVENIWDSTFKISDAIKITEDKINEISVSMSQLVQNVNDIASLSQNASETAQSGSVDTKEGQKIVSNIIDIIKQQTQTINATSINIQDLQNAGISIGEVMEVINSIAEQTNLLALNAAIEAARAGEAGRGFAVVADEVRNLAGRTHESTQEIQTTVEKLQTSILSAAEAMNASIKQSSITGVEAVRAGERLDKLTVSIQSMEQMNLQIAQATEEQSATFDNLNSNLSKVVNLATQTNNLSMDLTNKGAQLSDTAQNLKKLIERFKI